MPQLHRNAIIIAQLLGGLGIFQLWPSPLHWCLNYLKRYLQRIILILISKFQVARRDDRMGGFPCRRAIPISNADRAAIVVFLIGEDAFKVYLL